MNFKPIVRIAPVIAVIGILLLTSGAIAAGPTRNGPAESGAVAAVTATAIPESSYVAITPCRIVVSWNGGGRLGVDVTRDFYVRGTTGFATQGGTSGGCGIPNSATAVALSITTTDSSGTRGRLNFYPSDAPEPATTVATYWGDRVTTTNANVALAASDATKPLRVHNYYASTHLAIDVLGYYAPPMAGFIDLSGNVQSGTRIVSSTHVSTGNYVVTFDRSVANCSFLVTPYAYNWVVAVGPQSGNVNAAHVYIHDQTGELTSHDTSFFIQAIC